MKEPIGIRVLCYIAYFLMGLSAVKDVILLKLGMMRRDRS